MPLDNGILLLLPLNTRLADHFERTVPTEDRPPCAIRAASRSCQYTSYPPCWLRGHTTTLVKLGIFAPLGRRAAAVPPDREQLQPDGEHRREQRLHLPKRQAIRDPRRTGRESNETRGGCVGRLE